MSVSFHQPFPLNNQPLDAMHTVNRIERRPLVQEGPEAGGLFAPELLHGCCLLLPDHVRRCAAQLCRLGEGQTLITS